MTASFTMNVTAFGGTMTQPVSSDFTVKYGTSTSNSYVAPSVNVTTIPNANIAEGSTASVTVISSVPASSIPASGMYGFYISSIKYNIGGVAGTQTTGLENFRTTNMVNAVLGVTVPNPIPPCSSATLNRNLAIGFSGNDVAVLQNFLKYKGYLLIDPTAYFSSQTATALASYQVSKGIAPADGYFGVITRMNVINDCSGTATSTALTASNAAGSAASAARNNASVGSIFSRIMRFFGW